MKSLDLCTDQVISIIQNEELEETMTNHRRLNTVTNKVNKLLINTEDIEITAPAENIKESKGVRAGCPNENSPMEDLEEEDSL
jgi:hypothetical protein